MSDYIEIGYDEFSLFDNSQHFREWLLELHEECDLIEIEELKQACLDLSLDEYYLVCKEFEQKYLHK